jgi:hypothetical protein
VTDLEDFDLKVRLDELRDAECLVGFQLACAVRAMNLRHATPDPLVATLSEAYLELAGKRKRLQRAHILEVAG